MGRIFSFHTSQLLGAQTHEAVPIAYFEFTGASSRVTLIHSWMLSFGNRGNGVMECTSTVTVRRGTGATAGGGNAVANSVLEGIEDGDLTCAGSAIGPSTTLMTAGGGSVETLETHYWLLRSPLHRVYSPLWRPVVAPSGKWEISVETQPLLPAYSFPNRVAMTLFFEEIG